MSHIFTDDGKQWYLIPELPTKENPGYDTFVAENAHIKKRRERKHQMAIDRAKVNALPIVNPEVIPFTGEVGVLIEWPGTWEELNYGWGDDEVHKAKLIAPQQPQAETEEKLLERLKAKDPNFDLMVELGGMLMRHIDSLTPVERKRYDELVQGFIPPRFSSKVTHWMPLPKPPKV